jgi:hypothetical protein
VTVRTVAVGMLVLRCKLAIVARAPPMPYEYGQGTRNEGDKPSE